MRPTILRPATLALILGLASCAEEAPLEVPTWAHVAPEQIAEASRYGVPVAFENDLGMRFVLIPAGKFLMGSPEDEEGRDDYRVKHDVELQHEVAITAPFYVGIHEVTNRQYRSWRGTTPSGSYEDVPLSGESQPVVNVRHRDARAFAQWLSTEDGRRVYRLPTEAQWEWACRADTTTSFFWGDSAQEFARYANALDKSAADGPSWFRSVGVAQQQDGHFVSAPVGSYLPNPWGLYDMLGNVDEWCADWHGAYPGGTTKDPVGPAAGKGGEGQSPWYEYRVIRGGSWHALPVYLRCARRGSCDPKIGVVNLGFRLVSPLPGGR